MRLARGRPKRGIGQLCPARQGITGGGAILFTKHGKRIDVVDSTWDGMLKGTGLGVGLAIVVLRTCNEMTCLWVAMAPGAGDSSV